MAPACRSTPAWHGAFVCSSHSGSGGRSDRLQITPPVCRLHIGEGIIEDRAPGNPDQVGSDTLPAVRTPSETPRQKARVFLAGEAIGSPKRMVSPALIRQRRYAKVSCRHLLPGVRVRVDRLAGRILCRPDDRLPVVALPLLKVAAFGTVKLY